MAEVQANSYSGVRFRVANYRMRLGVRMRVMAIV